MRALGKNGGEGTAKQQRSACHHTATVTLDDRPNDLSKGVLGTTDLDRAPSVRVIGHVVKYALVAEAVPSSSFA